ncbi:hypothetical protein CHS0354_038706, partial [Potamilus streckersoni]
TILMIVRPFMSSPGTSRHFRIIDYTGMFFICLQQLNGAPSPNKVCHFLFQPW